MASPVPAGASAQSVVRSVVREVMDQCSRRQCPVSESLAAFMVKAVVLDPSSSFGMDAELSGEDVAALTEACVVRLTDSASASLDTIRMQTYMTSAFKTREEIVEGMAREEALKMEDLAREITDSRARSRDELEALYRKLIFFVMSKSKLGPPTDSGVVRESTAAFESVMPPVELGAFVALDRQKKLAQMQELSAVVGGIRLYNKYSKKGGAQIPDLPKDLSDSLAVVLQQLRSEYATFMEDVARMAAWLLANGSAPEAALVKDVQRNCWQYIVYLEVFLEEVCRGVPVIREVSDKMQARLESVRNTVQSKTAVPTEVIYPQFVELAGLWSQLQGEQQCLSAIVTHLAALSSFTQKRSHLPESLRVALLASALPESQKAIFGSMQRAFQHGVAVALGEPAASPSPPPGPAETLAGVNVDPCALLLPATTHDYENISLLIGGFCPVAVAQNGVLLPADRSLGLLKYNGAVYGFSSVANATSFAADVEKVLEAVVLAGRSACELIDLLDLHAAITAGTQKNVAAAFSAVPVSHKCDGGTQTEVHPVDRNIVKDYTWNEWDLRRKAIKLANLRTKKTHSTQTDKSNFRRDNATQIYLQKSSESQTKSDGTSSVPKPTTFVRGLRGAPDGSAKAVPVQVVDLTLGITGVTVTAKGKKTAGK